MSLFHSPTPYKGQSYSSLKKAAQSSGQLFVDNQFPAVDASLFYTAGKLAGVQWKRPKDICEDPKLFVEGASSGDVHQGRLGNCWFVAACSCLAQEKEIWHKVIPNWKDQEWNAEKPENYAGIFHFQFCRYGEWVDVVIDDQLPTINGELVFVHSKERNEFWSALLEKAYAKLFGCYEALDGGGLEEALVDFTGGIAEPIDLTQGYSEDSEKQGELYHVMSKEMDRRSLMAAAIPATSASEMEAHTDVGLVKGHAYGITAVKRVALSGTGLFNLFNKEKLAMVRLRNPWGEVEWKGRFSDGSAEWNKISSSDREKIGLTFEDDGEFWMLLEDYCRYFMNMTICRVVNTSFLSVHKKYHEVVYHGAWTEPDRAGGCANNKDTFLKNPQYAFTITEEEDEDVMISLEQKVGRGKDAEKDTIGFHVMKVEENRSYRLHQPQEMVKSSVFKNSRGIFLRHLLKKGRYVIVPATFDRGHPGNFLLRLYTSSSNDSKELSEDHPQPGMCACLFFTAPIMTTRVRLVKAVGLEKQDKQGGADPYCIVSCEGTSVRTRTIKDTVDPDWNESCIFFRRSAQKPIKVQIWNANVLKDEYMGKHVFTATDEVDNQMMEVELVGSKREGNVAKMGRLTVQISTSRDLDHF